MGAPRVRRARLAVEGEADPLLGADGAHLRVEDGGALGSELLRPVRGPRHALRRHVGVELERQPLDRDLARTSLAERALEPALADIAPGADDVGEDRDVHHNLAAAFAAFVAEDRAPLGRRHPARRYASISGATWP